MGFSKFWFYASPPGNGDLIEVNLRRTVTGLDSPYTEMRQAVATAFTGWQTTVQWGGTSRTRIRLEWNGLETLDRLVRRRLTAMINHLDRGGYVMFAADSDYLYAGATTGRPIPGQSQFNLTPLFEQVVPSVDLTGREIVIRSANPDCITESLAVTTHTTSGNRDVLHTGTGEVIFEYTDQPWVLVREAGTWPALRLPESERGRPHLTTDDEIRFVLDLPLEEDEAIIAALLDNAPDPAPVVIVGGTIGPGLDPHFP